MQSAWLMVSLLVVTAVCNAASLANDGEGFGSCLSSCFSHGSHEHVNDIYTICGETPTCWREQLGGDAGKCAEKCRGKPEKMIVEWTGIKEQYLAHFAKEHQLWYRHGDCPGNDIRSLTTILEVCSRTCKQTLGCTSFLWNEYNHCYLKRKSCSDVSTNDASNHFFDRMAPPNKYVVFGWERNLIYRHGDCPGHDLTGGYFTDTSLAICAAKCTPSWQCRAFLWTEGNECFLKWKSCEKINAADPKKHFFHKIY